MKKRIIAPALTLCMALSIALWPVISALGVQSLTNFNKVRNYSNAFSDVAEDSWYYISVTGAYEHYVLDGSPGGLFRPDDRITIAEIIKLAVGLHSIYYAGIGNFETGEPWYRPYVNYALNMGIISGEYKNYGAAATRADFAVIMAGALPDEVLTPINKTPDGAIPDVLESFSYGPEVYKLYRAGVLAGFDRKGTFFPSRTLSRAEAAVTAMRMIDADSRVLLSLDIEKTPEELFKDCAPAVFFIEVFDGDGDLVKTGSGFFISDSGLAVTNNHVVVGARSARITTQDGSFYDVSGIFDYDRKKDIALIKIDGEGFPYLDTADSDKVVTGATIYTIGCPLGLQNSFSRGIISGSQRELEGARYIQIDAVISSGSSGGALLNTYGRVIGITSAAVDGGQSLNLAIPINLIDELEREDYVPIESVIIEAADYPGYLVPDFGAFFGLEQYKPENRTQEEVFSYLVSDMKSEPELLMDSYSELLEQNLFSVYGYFLIEGNNFKAYHHSKLNMFVMLGLEKLDGKDCVTIQIS